MTELDVESYELVGADRAGVDWAGMDLSGVDLTDADLSGATLTDADLTLANLTGATLTDADLSGATLKQTNLTKATLEHATLADADLLWTIATRANLVGADLSESYLKNAYVLDARAAGADLSGASIHGTNVTEATLGAADLSDVNCLDAVFRDAALDGADLTGASLDGTFCGASLQRAVLRGATVRCDLRGARLAHADFGEAEFDDGVDLESAGSLEGARIPEAVDPREDPPRPRGPVHSVNVPVGPATDADAEPEHDLGPELAERIVESGLATPSQVAGCAEEEVRHVERACDVALPAAYRSMLKHVGRSCGDYMRGHDFEYDPARDVVSRLVTRTERARRLAERRGDPIAFSDDAFVFLSSQGTAYEYLYTGDDDPDPPVYGYAEADIFGEEIADSLSSHLLEKVDEHADAFVD